MSMRKRDREPQGVLFVAASDLPQGGGHPFYERLNLVLDQCGFDDYVEHFCQPYYAPKRGRPSIPPGVYFRMLMIGSFVLWLRQRVFRLRGTLRGPAA